MGCIISAGSGNNEFYALDGYWLNGMDDMDGLDGALARRGWDGRKLWAPEQEHHCWILRGGGLWEVVAGTNSVGAARTRSICV